MNGLCVGAAEGCDLLIFLPKGKIKGSQPRFTRQLQSLRTGIKKRPEFVRAFFMSAKG
jgi:hypothetical protein